MQVTHWFDKKCSISKVFWQNFLVWRYAERGAQKPYLFGSLPLGSFPLEKLPVLQCYGHTFV